MFRLTSHGGDVMGELDLGHLMGAIDMKEVTVRSPWAIAAAVALMCLVVGFVGVTLAFMTTTVDADNVISFGNVSVRVLESEMTEHGERDVPNGHRDHAQNGGTASRIVRFQNAGSAPCYVRARVTTEVDGGIDGADGDDVAMPEINVGDGSDGWVEGDDGWFYYLPSLDGADDGFGETSEPIMDELAFSDDTSAIVDDGEIRMCIEVQAVQSDNNGDTSVEAIGWPDGEVL